MLDPSWQTKRLAEVCAKITDGTHRSPPATPAGRLYVTSKNIRPFRFDVSEPTFISEQDHREIFARCDVRKGDVLLTKDGANTGNACLNPLDEPFSLLSSVALIRARPDLLASDFLVQVLNSSAGRALSASRMDGLAIRRLTLEKINALPVLLPPLAEQRKIAAILSSVDETIEKTEAVIAQLDVVKKAMLDELLTRGIPGQHSRFKQTEIGEVPETWEVAPIRAIANVVRGSSPRPAGDPRYFNGSFVPWITVGEITRDPWPFLERTVTGLTKEGHERSRLLRRGTVVLTNSGATLGVPKILRIDGCANDGVAALLDLSTAIEPLFAYYVLLKMTEEFRRDVARGVGQPNLNTDLIGNVLLPIPDLPAQRSIAAALFSIDERVRIEAEAQAVLRKVKESLAAQLLSGASRVGIDGATT